MVDPRWHILEPKCLMTAPCTQNAGNKRPTLLNSYLQKKMFALEYCQETKLCSPLLGISEDTITLYGTAGIHGNTSYGIISHHSEGFFKNTRTWEKYI